MIVKLSKLKSTKLEVNYLTKKNWFSRIDFLYLLEEVSPLFAIILFCHDILVRFFLKNLKRPLLAVSYFLGMCCNGAQALYKMFPKRKVTKFLKANQFVFILFTLRLFSIITDPQEGIRLYDMKVVSGYAFLQTYYVYKK